MDMQDLLNYARLVSGNIDHHIEKVSNKLGLITSDQFKNRKEIYKEIASLINELREKSKSLKHKVAKLNP